MLEWQSRRPTHIRVDQIKFEEHYEVCIVIVDYDDYSFPIKRVILILVPQIIKCVFRGYCENLMDDLLRRMEQYANNLEVLVSEKTDELSQEKRRSEELLYQVIIIIWMSLNFKDFFFLFIVWIKWNFLAVLFFQKNYFCISLHLQNFYFLVSTPFGQQIFILLRIFKGFTQTCGPATHAGRNGSTGTVRVRHYLFQRYRRLHQPLC